MNIRCMLVSLFSAVALWACDGDDARLRDVTLAELAASPQAYDGRAVRTRGTVRGFENPRHYWLEDPRINRVGLEPMDMIAPHLGREVTILGRFSYSRERGRRIAIDAIESYEAAR